MLEMFRMTGRFLTKAIGTGQAKLSFSQFGEDMVLSYYLRTCPNKFYIDVGCNDPHRYSNTYVLHNVLGWRGMNIDMDPNCIEKMAADRPEDVNICTAVSDRSGEIEATFFDDNAVNSVSPVFVEHQAKMRKTDRVAMIPAERLDVLIERHYPHPAIGLLSIDAEGHDLEVLSSIDLDRHKPMFILIETGVLGSAKNEIHTALEAKGYRMRSHMVITSLYERVHDSA